MIAKTLGTIFIALFTAGTIWGRGVKFVLVLVSLVTLPLGAFLWPLLVKHGIGASTRRARDRAAEKYGLKGSPIIEGSATGAVIDKEARRFIFFNGVNAETSEIGFDDIVDWEWQWVDKNAVKTDNKIVLKTLDENRPLIVLAEFTAAGAEYWHHRISLVLGRA